MQGYQLCRLGRTAALRLRPGVKTRGVSPAVPFAKRGLLTQSYARGPTEVSVEDLHAHDARSQIMHMESSLG